MCRSKHVEPSINFGIINSITKLHLVGISTESSTINTMTTIFDICGEIEIESGRIGLSIQTDCHL